MNDLRIKRIDIENFGCFKNYKQHGRANQPSIGNDFDVNNINIFYGRNYSGKSTYSKIFQSIELKKLPEKYDDISFEIKLANDTVIKSNDIDSKPLPIDCRVFNQQFVNDNIELHNNNKINSFAISIGADTKGILKKINHIRMHELNPLNKNLSNIQDSLKNKQDLLKNEEDNFNSKLQKIASNIRYKKNPSIITGKKYDRIDLKREFEDYREDFPTIPSENSQQYLELTQRVEQAETKILEKNIQQPRKIDISNSIINFDFNLFEIEIKELLYKVIKVSNILDEYQNNPDKINWIKQGIEIHGSSPEKCIFCGNSIDNALIDNLTSAFSDELKSLETELENKKTELELMIERLTSISQINKDEYFKNVETDIINLNKDIKNTTNNNANVLKNILYKIEEKQRDIFSKIEIGELTWEPFTEIQSTIDNLYDNTIIEINNYEARKKESIDFLRRYYIAKELSVREFDDSLITIQELQTSINTEIQNKDSIKLKISEIEKTISQLENSLKSETKAINHINKILYNSLSHSEIFLSPVEDDKKKIYFEVHRNNENAYNLSEGEKSLIAFAYYIAKLESLNIEEKKKTILFIDDPISSLDENNIFYVYNLIYCLLNKKEFLQYFLSTHNMDFLKYTNRFSTKKDYYLIEKIKTPENNPSKSYITSLPKYLSNKVTEFVFLFEQIYKVATEEENENNFHIFYNFPNNARKFIETLLYFKYPDYKINNDTKVNKYFGEEISPFIQRINNEYSHGEDRFDRTQNPINTSEFKHDAIIILKTIYENDSEQFHSFLNNSNLKIPDFLQSK